MRGSPGTGGSARSGRCSCGCRCRSGRARRGGRSWAGPPGVRSGPRGTRPPGRVPDGPRCAGQRCPVRVHGTARCRPATRVSTTTSTPVRPGPGRPGSGRAEGSRPGGRRGCLRGGSGPGRRHRPPGRPGPLTPLDQSRRGCGRVPGSRSARASDLLPCPPARPRPGARTRPALPGSTRGTAATVPGPRSVGPAVDHARPRPCDRTSYPAQGRGPGARTPVRAPRHNPPVTASARPATTAVRARGARPPPPGRRVTRDALTAPPPRARTAVCTACARTTHAPVPVRTGEHGPEYACPHCVGDLTPGPAPDEVPARVNGGAT
jgi:hypothetical protein